MEDEEGGACDGDDGETEKEKDATTIFLEIIEALREAVGARRSLDSVFD